MRTAAGGGSLSHRPFRPHSLVENRVTTCLEKLEMSGNLTAVGEMSDFTKSQGNWEKILSGKSGLKLFIVSCIFASMQVFSRSLFCVKY